MVFLLCWTLILLSDKAHYSRGVASPVLFAKTLNPYIANSTVLQFNGVCVYNNAACLSRSTVAWSLHSILNSKYGFINELHCQNKSCSISVCEAAAIASHLSDTICNTETDSITPYYLTWSNAKLLIFHNRRTEIWDGGSSWCISSVRPFWQHMDRYMSRYPLHLYIRFYYKMKVALMELIWKSADPSSALADPDSCMEMRSQTDALYFVWEHTSIVIILSPKMRSCGWTFAAWGDGNLT